MKLDVIPKFWENRLALYCAHLINKGTQSSTVRSYITAMKGILIDDNYKWNDDLVVLQTLVKVCRTVNDRVKPRFPIHCKLLELILFEVEREFHDQIYLKTLYKTILAWGYYGMFHIGEMTKSNSEHRQHTILAKNVYMAVNKNKILVVLYTSKLTVRLLCRKKLRSQLMLKTISQRIKNSFAHSY